MRARTLLLTIICIITLCFMSSCGKGGETGACTLSCGGAGTGQPFFWQNIPFVSESECQKRGEERGGGCKASYCPPTGNSNDCYQVYP